LLSFFSWARRGFSKFFSFIFKLELGIYSHNPMRIEMTNQNWISTDEIQQSNLTELWNSNYDKVLIGYYRISLRSLQDPIELQHKIEAIIQQDLSRIRLDRIEFDCRINSPRLCVLYTHQSHAIRISDQKIITWSYCYNTSTSIEYHILCDFVTKLSLH
jgi:hypothetical protein